MRYLVDKEEIIERIREKPSSVRRLYIKKEKAYLAEKVLELARMHGIKFKVLPEEVFKRKAKSKEVNYLLEVEPKEYIEPEEFLARISKKKNPLIFAFDGIYDPQNFGNILRSSGCFEFDGIVLPKDRTCPITEKVIEISKGGYEYTNLIRVTNLPRFLEELKKLDIRILGMDEKAEKSIFETDLREGVCIVLGREDGLRRLTRERCEEILKIPTSKRFSSLNLATCFAISLYEAFRQRNLARV